MAGDQSGSSLMQGDFMDSIVQGMMSNLVSQLKIEYQREIRKALQATQDGLPREAKAEEEDKAVYTLRGVAAANEEDVRLQLKGEKLISFPQVRDEDHRQHLISLSSMPGVPDAAGAETEASNHVECIVRMPAGESCAGDGDKPPTSRSGREDDACQRNSDASSKNAKQKKLKKKPSNGKRNSSSGDEEQPRTNTPSARVSTATSESSGSKRKKVIELDEEEVYALNMMRAEEEKKELAAKSIGRGLYAIRSTTMMMADMEGLSEYRIKALKLISNAKFDVGMGAFILVNAVTIGMESTHSRNGETVPMSLNALEYICLFAYTVELLIRFYALGVKEALTNNWIRLDCMLVFSGFLNLLINAVNIGGEIGKVMDNINMLKMIRLFRLARVVRLLAQFRTLWMLVQGLMSCLMPMLWTSLIMIVVIYVFAVAGMELITEDASRPDNYNASATKFESIYQSMITLMQFMTLDSVNLIYRPLTTHNPVLSIYFLTFLLIGPIALMNIITAIQVEAMFRAANEDVEAKKAWELMKRKTMMPKLRSIFLELDADGSGEVDLDELESAPIELKEQLTRIVDLGHVEEVFKMLDIDGSGAIDIDEFIDGIMRSQQDKPTELILIMKQNQCILDHLMTVSGGLQSGFRAAQLEHKMAGKPATCDDIPEEQVDACQEDGVRRMVS